MLVLSSSPIVFGYNKYNPTLEDQLGNLTKTKLVNDGAILILNQTVQKLVYKVGENIAISTELINIGNKTADITYGEPWVALEIKNQNGDEVWPNSGIAAYPEFQGKKTLQPGEHLSEQPWGLTSAPDIFPHVIQLSSPGNFTAISVAIFKFTTPSENPDSVGPLWSKPLRITILPEHPVQNHTMPINASAVAVHIDLANKPQTYEKNPCCDLVIKAEVDNPIDASGTIMDPNGTIKPMTKVLLENGKMQLDFNVTQSDPSGKYVVLVKVVKGPQTSDLTINTEELNREKYPTLLVSHPALQQPSESWCTGCIPPNQLQTNGILVPLVVAAAVIGICFFLFRHFKD